MKTGSFSAGAGDGGRPDDAAEVNVFGTGSFTGITLEGLIDPCVWYVPVHDPTGQIVDLRYVDANRAACDYNGVSREELLGRTLMELFPAHGHTGMLQSYIDVVESGEPLLLDDVVYETDERGHFLWVSPSVQRVLGWLPEQLIDTRAWALVDPDDLTRLETHSACATANRKSSFDARCEHSPQPTPHS